MTPPFELRDLGTAMLVVIAVGIAAVGVVGAVLISRWRQWPPAGPITLLVMAPLVPAVPIAVHVSLDDVLPVVGLGLLAVRSPLPALSRNVLVRFTLVALVVAMLARVASAVANSQDILGFVTTSMAGLGRPAFMVAAVALVSVAVPAGARRRVATVAMAAVGTIEAAVGLSAFVTSQVGLGVQAIRLQETLGGCITRITGTLGLSPNHIGAIFVLSIPITLALAARETGWRRVGWSLAAGLQGAALVLTFTRASILIVALMIVAFLLLQRQARLFAVVAGAVAVTALTVVVATQIACSTASPVPPPPTGVPAPTQPPVDDGAGLGDRFGDSSDRLALWYSAALIMLDHQWFGVGLGQMPDTIAENPERYMHTPYGVAINSAHNTVLLAGAETGVLGAIGTGLLNIGLGLMALWWAFRARGDVLLAAVGLSVLGFLVQGMVNNLFTVPATSIPAAVLIGAFLSTLPRAFSWRQLRAPVSETGTPG